MDSFYKPLTPEQSGRAFRNEYDFDAPEAIDFDYLVGKLRDIKTGYVEISNCRPDNPLMSSSARKQIFLSTRSRSTLG